MDNQANYSAKSQTNKKKQSREDNKRSESRAPELILPTEIDDEIETLLASGRPQRKKRKTSRYIEVSQTKIEEAKKEVIPTPGSVKQAMNGLHAKEWKTAMDIEYNALIENQTWELVELPKGRRAIPSMWLFGVKYKSCGR